MDIHHMALSYRALGHEVRVLAALPGRRRLLPYRARQLAARDLRVVRDSGNGYETARVGAWLVPRLLRESIAEQRPDLVIVQGGNAEVLAQAAVGLGVPVIMRHIDVGSVDMLAEAARRDPQVRELLHNPLFRLVSISHFVAGRVRELLGVSPVVIHPLIRLEDSAAEHRRPEYITFVNPIPVKGLPLVLEIAALLPERKFLFVEAWQRSGRERAELDRQLAGLPNVSFRCRSPGLRDVYGSTAILLVPSQCPEGFGRVVIEACANGIPVVASRIGGIPEAIGESGILLGAEDPASDWAKAIDHALSDPAHYAKLSAAALANFRRPEFQENVIAEEFLGVSRNLTGQPAGERTARE